MRVFQGPNLATLHELAVNNVLQNHFRNEDGTSTVFPGESEQGTIESEPFALVCKTPFVKPMFIDNPKKHPTIGTQRYMDKYAHDLIYGTQNVFVYDYHDRLFRYNYYEGVNDVGTINQISYIINKLKNPTTRRAVAITWQPWNDTKQTDVPCLQLIHCTIREGKLNMEVVFRSEDMLFGAGANMFGLAHLQDYIASQIGVGIGTYTHVALSPHLILTNEDQLREFSGWKYVRL